MCMCVYCVYVHVVCVGSVCMCECIFVCVYCDVMVVCVVMCMYTTEEGVGTGVWSESGRDRCVE